jgi:hypothetical protein
MMTNMKTLKNIAAVSLAFVFVTGPLTGLAAEEKKTEKPKPYPLKTCVVTDEKFGGDMGDPYVFTEANQEVKLCCKSCLKDFNKDKAKYMKKIAAGDKKK